MFRDVSGVTNSEGEIEVEVGSMTSILKIWSAGKILRGTRLGRPERGPLGRCTGRAGSGGKGTTLDEAKLSWASLTTSVIRCVSSTSSR